LRRPGLRMLSWLWLWLEPLRLRLEPRLLGRPVRLRLRIILGESARLRRPMGLESLGLLRSIDGSVMNVGATYSGEQNIFRIFI